MTINQSERDKFELTFGNLQVLKTIPDMMIEPYWRKQLRMLVLDYISAEVLGKCKENEGVKT